MISKNLMKGGTISIGMKGKEFTFEVKKGKEAEIIMQPAVAEKK